MADLSKLSFFSGVNYLKRDDSLTGDGSTTFTGVPGEVAGITIDHNLGYIPFVSVGAELSEPGILWSNNTTPLLRVSTDDTVRFLYWTTPTQLIIRHINSIDNPVTGIRWVNWVIYLDYGT